MYIPAKSTTRCELLVTSYPEGARTAYMCIVRLPRTQIFFLPARIYPSTTALHSGVLEADRLSRRLHLQGLHGRHANRLGNTVRNRLVHGSEHRH